MSKLQVGTIPILDHLHSKLVGFIRCCDGEMMCEFNEDSRITEEMMLEMLAGAGIRITEMSYVDGRLVVRKAQILDFSLKRSK